MEETMETEQYRRGRIALVLCLVYGYARIVHTLVIQDTQALIYLVCLVLGGHGILYWLNQSLKAAAPPESTRTMQWAGIAIIGVAMLADAGRLALL